ncbi:drug/metabolite transporter (DMT)-like permease [Pseudonocardia eucalypti]|nr:drug/metabolite transporter (DMT)-like permease [Pseudonocardia eucalypti]
MNPLRTAPALWVATGAACISASAGFVKLAGADPGSTAFLRCAMALVVLVPMAGYELYRRGRLDARTVCVGLASGVLLGLDFLMWTVAIFDVGAGIATVLVNVQVIVFPVLALMFGGTPIPRRFLLASPVMLAGVALAGGALGAGAGMTNPVRGTLLSLAAGVAYAGYLYLNRLSTGRRPTHLVTPVCLATFAAAATAGVIAPFTSGLTFDHPPATWAWLIGLALLGQVVAWLLISYGSRRLAPNISGALLLLQPVLAVLFGVALLGERPTLAQLAGCLVVVVAIWVAVSGSAGRADDQLRGEPVVLLGGVEQQAQRPGGDGLHRVAQRGDRRIHQL